MTYASAFCPKSEAEEVKAQRGATADALDAPIENLAFLDLF
jgi:hypothetical protein